MVTKYCSIKLLVSSFSEDQTINDGLAASQYQLIAAKLVNIIIIICCFMLKNKVCIITASWVIYKIFSYLGSGFRTLEYRSTNTPLSYIMHNMAMHVQAKAFAGTRGETMFPKTFPNFYTFQCKNDCSNPKIRS